MDDHLEFASEPSAQREPPSHFLHLTEAVSHVLNLLQHVGVTCPRVSTYLTLPCSCLKRGCCVSKLRQLYTPLGQLLTCPARSFGSELYVTNSHRTSTISGRSSASVGTLAQHTSMLAAKQDKDAGFCIFSRHLPCLLTSPHCFILLGLFTSKSATFIRHFPHFACVFPRCALFLLLLSPWIGLKGERHHSPTCNFQVFDSLARSVAVSCCGIFVSCIQLS